MYQNNFLSSEKKDIVFTPLGGVSEVGATSYLIHWYGKRIIIDAGKRKSGKLLFPEYQELDREIDILFITHIHGDHIGSLMEYYDFFNIKKIISTQETKDCLRYILLDAKKIMSYDKRQKDNLEYYDEEKIDSFISKLEVHKYYKSIKFTEELLFTLIPTSHLIGSCGVLLQSKNYKLFITSDYTESKKFFHPDTNFYPLINKNIDTIITETTYGSNEDSTSVSKEQTLSQLEHYINKIFNSTEQGGNILIPAFAIGRTQEVILALLKLKMENRITNNTKIRVPFKLYKARRKSLAQVITEKYYEKYKHFIESELGINLQQDFYKFANMYLEPIDLVKEYKDFIEGKDQILITTPGMLGGHIKEHTEGRILAPAKLALDILESKRHGIIFVGYQAPGTLGGETSSCSYRDSIKYTGKTYTRNTPHIYKVTFPGHVSTTGILELIDNMNPKNVILTHGDIKSSTKIAKAIRSKSINVLVPEIEEKIYLIDNNKKVFFSTHHKHANIIVDYSESFDEANADEPIMKLLRDKILQKDPDVNHIYFFIKSNDEILKKYTIIKEQLRSRNYTSDIIEIYDHDDINGIIKNLNEIISEIALQFKEKFTVYIHKTDFYTTLPISIISQLLNEEIYVLDDNGDTIKLPKLPIDIDTLRYKRMNTKENYLFSERGHGAFISTEYDELLDRIMYYKKRNKPWNKGRTMAEMIPNQLPMFKKESLFFKKDVFASNNKTLWGDIETIYDIKNDTAVRALTDIINILNQKIKLIKFTNYIHTYKYHRPYREIIGYDHNRIFFKLVLENGVQFFYVDLSFGVNIKEELKRIKVKKIY